MGVGHPGRHNEKGKGHPAVAVQAAKPFLPPELIIQDELHLITGSLGTIYGGYETVIEELCTYEYAGRKVRPKYINLRELGGTVRLLQDNIPDRMGLVFKKFGMKNARPKALNR